MINYKSILIITMLFLTLAACRKERTYEVEGIITNKVTGEPIEGALVHLRDAVGSNALIEGPEVNNVDEDYTGENGSFHVKITTERGHGVFYASKEGYRWINPTHGDQTVHRGLKQGKTIANFKLEGRAYFKPQLLKTSAPSSSDDSLCFSLLSYDSFEENYRSIPTKIYSGFGPFMLSTSEEGRLVLGDRYLRYKMEYTDEGVWKEKIDSVFLPTTLEVFTDTLTY